MTNIGYSELQLSFEVVLFHDYSYVTLSILDDAIKFNRFMVYYQPIYSTNIFPSNTQSPHKQPLTKTARSHYVEERGWEKRQLPGKGWWVFFVSCLWIGD